MIKESEHYISKNWFQFVTGIKIETAINLARQQGYDEPSHAGKSYLFGELLYYRLFAILRKCIKIRAYDINSIMPKYDLENSVDLRDKNFFVFDFIDSPNFCFSEKELFRHEKYVDYATTFFANIIVDCVGRIKKREYEDFIFINLYSLRTKLTQALDFVAERELQKRIIFLHKKETYICGSDGTIYVYEAKSNSSKMLGDRDERLTATFQRFDRKTEGKWIFTDDDGGREWIHAPLSIPEYHYLPDGTDFIDLKTPLFPILL